MNEINYKTFKQLNNAEARQFFILYVGLDNFLKGYNVHPLTKRQFQKEISITDLLKEYQTKPFSFRLKIEKERGNEYILYRNEDRKFLSFYLNDEILTEFNGVDKYNDELPNQIIELLLDVAHNDISSDLGYKRISELRDLRKPSKFKYKFILGAGINHGYGMPSWEELENDFINVLDGLLGKSACKSINESTFNTNYGTFQIVKDVIYPQYESKLKNMINAAVAPSKGDNTTLEAVSAVLDAQRKIIDNQIVLTFNYDDLLEQSLSNCFAVKSKSVYKSDSKIDSTAPVNVIHSHGYLPKTSPIPKKYFNSVVLTTDEYFDNYKYPSAYGYSSLYFHLDDTCCFVGNSLTDYEEQKVISAHFAKNPASFHYWYGAFEDRPIEAIMYKTVFLLKIGVIPLWFSDHDQYKGEFFNYAKGLNETNER